MEERKKGRIVTSESVTEGHPDKICDQIADAILDDMLRQDPDSFVACEVMASTGIIFVMGEVTTKADTDINAIVRESLKKIGYKDAASGIDAENCAIITTIRSQSPDIAIGVAKSQEVREGKEDLDPLSAQGAGDQGLVFGYACDDTPEFMPLAIVLAHRLTKKLSKLRKEGLIKGLRPDGKSQVSVEYDVEGRPLRVDAVLISAQHEPDIDQKNLKEEIWDKLVLTSIDPSLLDSDTKFFFNPTGQFVMGGPNADTGLTGRKLIVDTYGGAAHHGGGAFSGKDPSKLDRSGAYYARYVAKNLVAAGLCKKVEIAVSYAIGRAYPFSISLDSYNTGFLPDEVLLEIVKKIFDFRPLAIIEKLDLRRPIYAHTASYGHFGRRDDKYPWEETDRVEELIEEKKKYE